MTKKKLRLALMVLLPDDIIAALAMISRPAATKSLPSCQSVMF